MLNEFKPNCNFLFTLAKSPTVFFGIKNAPMIFVIRRNYVILIRCKIS